VLLLKVLLLHLLCNLLALEVVHMENQGSTGHKALVSVEARMRMVLKMVDLIKSLHNAEEGEEEEEVEENAVAVTLAVIVLDLYKTALRMQLQVALTLSIEK